MASIQAEFERQKTFLISKLANSLKLIVGLVSHVKIDIDKIRN